MYQPSPDPPVPAMADPYVIIVSGWRYATPAGHGMIVRNALQVVRLDHGSNVILRHGACHLGGIDKIAHDIGAEWNWQLDPMPAHRDVNGNLLGPLRNAAMCAKTPRPNEFIALPSVGSRQRGGGTLNLIQAAISYGIPGRIIPI